MSTHGATSGHIPPWLKQQALFFRLPSAPSDGYSNLEDDSDFLTGSSPSATEKKQPPPPTTTTATPSTTAAPAVISARHPPNATSARFTRSNANALMSTPLAKSNNDSHAKRGSQTAAERSLAEVALNRTHHVDPSRAFQRSMDVPAMSRSPAMPHTHIHRTPTPPAAAPAAVIIKLDYTPDDVECFRLSDRSRSVGTNSTEDDDSFLTGRLPFTTSPPPVVTKSTGATVLLPESELTTTAFDVGLKDEAVVDHGSHTAADDAQPSWIDVTASQKKTPYHEGLNDDDLLTPVGPRRFDTVGTAENQCQQMDQNDCACQSPQPDKRCDSDASPVHRVTCESDASPEFYSDETPTPQRCPFGDASPLHSAPNHTLSRAAVATTSEANSSPEAETIPGDVVLQRTVNDPFASPFGQDEEQQQQHVMCPPQASSPYESTRHTEEEGEETPCHDQQAAPATPVVANQPPAESVAPVAPPPLETKSSEATPPPQKKDSAGCCLVM